MQELPKHYDHQAAQVRCRAIWGTGRFWHAEPSGPGDRRPVFSNVIPPPCQSASIRDFYPLIPALAGRRLHGRLEG